MSADSGLIARRVGERAADMIRFLSEENARLRERNRQLEKIDMLPLIPREDGGEVWWAIKEDMRDEGLVTLEVSHDTWISLTFVPVDSGSSAPSQSVTE